MQEIFEIGQIVNSYGIKGFVKVVPFTDDITRFEKLNTIYVEQGKKLIEFTIEDVKYSKKLVLLKFKGIDDINDTISLKNCYLKVNREHAAELDEGSYYIVDLIGLEVYTDENKLLGNLCDVFPTGSNDVYVVKDKDGKQILLPAIKEVIRNVDIENKKMIVHLIPGLV